MNLELIFDIYLFLSLQGTMSVTEYRDRFLQLARYAPADVADDRKNQEHRFRFWPAAGSEQPGYWDPDIYLSL